MLGLAGAVSSANTLTESEAQTASKTESHELIRKRGLALQDEAGWQAEGRFGSIRAGY